MKCRNLRAERDSVKACTRCKRFPGDYSDGVKVINAFQRFHRDYSETITLKHKEIQMTKIFPIILMALDLCAAVAYACNCDWKRTIYWIAAAMLTATVTF